MASTKRDGLLKSEWLPQVRAGDTCAAKKEKKNKGRKERVPKQKLLKGFHQGQNVTILAILERLEFKNVSCQPIMLADDAFQYSMAPPL